MKIAVIYSTSNKITKKTCEMIGERIECEIQLIPVDKAKSECLLKYNFIVLSASAYRGKVQSALKRYISMNLKTLREKPLALTINCENEKDRFTETFGEELVDSSYICSNFGYELDSAEENIIDRIINHKSEKLPEIDMDEINRFSDYMNNLITKRVD